MIVSGIADFAVLAESLLPNGSKRETLDPELVPPDLVRGVFNDKGKCKDVEWVGKWDDTT
jgi:hypothetical protein